MPIQATRCDPEIRARRKEQAQPLSIRNQVFRRDEYRCHYCREAATTLDHRVPQSRGGPYTVANLVACCVDCNRDKGYLSYAAFMAALPIVLAERQAADKALRAATLPASDPAPCP